MDGMETIGLLAGNLLAGAIQKHKTKLPNDAIPFVNGALSTGAAMILTGGNVSESLKIGVMIGAAGTGTHQAGKIVQRAANVAIPWLIRKVFRAGG